MSISKALLISALVAAMAMVGIGCSSAPKQPDRELAVQNRAGQYAQHGNAYFARAEYQMALQFFDLALQANISVDNLPGIAKSYNSIGRVFMVTGNLTEAESNYRLALDFALVASDTEQELQAYVNLAEAALRADDPDQAFEYLQRAEQLVADPPTPVHAVLYHNLGTLHARRGDLPSAEELVRRAAQLNEQFRAWPELGSNYFMLASILSRRADYSAALTAAQQALEWDKRAENSPGIAQDLRAIGIILERMERLEEAYAHHLRALRIFISLNKASETVDVLSRLTNLAHTLGRDDEAMSFEAQRERIDAALATTGTRR